ncbi:MAG: Xaa-Pro peptidase family protein [Porphyromonadaceae bacterium]|nr:Xaa-Pro peptidase family protein [Porphyromonadaceae bacterium]
MIHNDCFRRHERLQSLMRAGGIDAMLVASNVGLLYLFGQIYSGLAYVPAEGEAQFFVRRPQTYGEHPQVHYVRKIEQIADYVDLSHIKMVALELDELSYAEVERQRKLLPSATLANATQLLRTARMVKTEEEIKQIRHTAEAHMQVYRQIPQLYRSGMTDVELQIEIERVMRLSGSVGIFRTFGSAMEIYMGSLIAGDNAAVPSPYDFAMGGAGSMALPLGSSGVVIEEGTAVMVDMAGNYGVYMSDMTRTFSVGELTDEAYRLHELSRRLHREVMQAADPNTSCADIYNHTLELVEREGASEYFMGLDQKAQFVGHGLGLQINEMPVLMGRSRDVLQTGMIIAYEPKFVLPRIGAVGVENTYLVTETGVENLTPLDEAIINLKQ